MKVVKESYALCNTKMEPVMHFADKTQMDAWITRQIKLHGKSPSSKPCLITTTVETKELT